jgi:hypothetical protein
LDIALLAILFSLGKALFHLTSGKGNPDQDGAGVDVADRPCRSGCSLLMLFAAHQGWISPHGVGR